MVIIKLFIRNYSRKRWQYLRQPKKQTAVNLWKNMTIQEMSLVFSCSVNHMVSLFQKHSPEFQVEPNQTLDIKNQLPLIRKIADEFNFIDVNILKVKPNHIQEKENIEHMKNKIRNEKDVSVINYNLEEYKKLLKPRKPIVTIMGHVDHGKTTLLDKLRNSRIVEQEFGNITQHIGAFQVDLSDFIKDNYIKHDFKDKTVTFIDTPGHAAFSTMRLRGTACTDIVIIMIAAEDGMMPQTIESIRFAQDAGVPMIIAVNKMDKLVKSELELKELQTDNKKLNEKMKSLWNNLAQHGVDVELMNNEKYQTASSQVVLISALKCWNLSYLIEAILLQADILRNDNSSHVDSCMANYEGNVEGTILEANKGGILGPEATVLIHHGILKKGIIGVAGHNPCVMLRVKNIQSTDGLSKTEIKEARPGDAVRVVGWKKGIVPKAGDELIQVPNESKAKSVISYRESLLKNQKTDDDYEAYLQLTDIYREKYRAYINKSFSDGIRIYKDIPKLEEYLEINENILENQLDRLGRPHVHIIIKTDVQGSLDAIMDILNKAKDICEEQIVLKFLLCDVGPLTESELNMAVTKNCLIYLFNLPPCDIKEIPSNIQLHRFNIIYCLFQHIHGYMQSKIPYNESMNIIGEAKIEKLFKSQNINFDISGCTLIKGDFIKQKYKFRLLRKQKNDNDADVKDDGYYVVKDNLLCKSLKDNKREIEKTKGINQFGLILMDEKNIFDDLQVGDIIECYQLDNLQQKLLWSVND